MIYQVLLSKRAQKDIRTAMRRMSAVSPTRVEQWQADCWKAIASLETLPMRCSLIKEKTKSKGLRHLLFDNFRIIFSIKDDDTVFVAHIRHQRQKPLSSNDI